MKENNIYVGIDVSKLTLDIHVNALGAHSHQVIKNSTKGISLFLDELTETYPTRNILIGIENTGLYNWIFYEVAQLFKVDLFVLHPLHLKRSMGMVRGKNDKIDADRISNFIALHYKRLKPYEVPQKSIQKVKLLTTQRARLIKERSAIKTSQKEVEITGVKIIIKLVQKMNKKLINHINQAIKEVETAINAIISTDLKLKHTFDLITSVPGVGKILGWELLVKTDGFNQLTNPRKLACYAGVVPFDFSSGTSIYKRPRTSVLADRKLKKLLHMASLRVIQIDGELKNYFHRKVEQGKNKMSVLNAIRNKILARVCATIKNQQKYIDQSLVLS